MFQVSFREVSWVCQGSFKDVSRMFRFKGGSADFRCVLSKFSGHFNEINGCFKEISMLLVVSREFQGSFNVA